MSNAIAMRPASDGVMNGGQMLNITDTLSGTQKAAVIVQALVSKGGAVSLATLSPSAQERLAREFTSIAHVDQPVLDSVIAEFEASLEPNGLKFPSDLTARIGGLNDVLDGDLLGGLRETMGLVDDADIWRDVGALDSERLTEVLASESPRIGALILSKLPPARASEILGELPDDQKASLAQTMADTEEASPALVDAIGLTMLSSSRKTGENALDGDPVGRIAAILDAAKPAARDHMLAVLSESDPEFAKRVRAAIFTFEDIPARVTIEDVPKVVREVAPEDMLAALGYAGENAKDTLKHILENMSSRMADQLKEEIQEAGEVKQDHGEAAQGRVASAIRAMQDRGEITLNEIIDTEEAM